jgi:2,3,4,5-tetrahydropyridine-2-carboxylate N-succinyltransferase
MTDASPVTQEQAAGSGRITAPARRAWGLGLATVTEGGTVLDTWYPAPQLGEAPDDAGPHAVPADLAALQDTDPHRRVRQTVVRTIIDLDAPPADVPDAYLRLHLLSHRLVAPHGVDLTGIFGILPNVVWTTLGPCAVDGFEATRLRLRAARTGTGRVEVLGVDKFPRMTDYVVPSGVRAPGPRDHRHARGLRQLQRRHARRLDGRGADLRRRRRR